MVALIVLKELAQIIINYIIEKRVPDNLRKLIIFVLRKERKKDYLLLGIYRLIELKNTVAKLVEKLVIIYITKMTKANQLLL